MKIGITGGTGFLGTALCRKLVRSQHELVLFGRNRERSLRIVPEAQFVQWFAEKGLSDISLYRGLDAFVHLAGEPIAGGRWTASRKRNIRNSRILGTRNLLEGFRRCGEAPGVLVSSSAIGIYGSRGDEELIEESPPGQGFLADLCVEWEREASQVTGLGSRLVLLRTGMVLSPNGGALSKLLLPFKLGAGGRLGSGKQYVSWIHISDQIRLIEFALTNESLCGPINATAPNPVTNRVFTRELGEVLKRPTLVPLPGFVLRLLLGEMADVLLLEGQRVLPKNASDSGFKFRFSELEEALRDLLG